MSAFPPKNSIYLPKCFNDFFLVIDIFRLLASSFPMGAKSVAGIDTGRPKSILFNKITILPLLSLSRRGGQTPLPISMGGPWPDLPPWIRHWPPRRDLGKVYHSQL